MYCRPKITFKIKDVAAMLRQPVNIRLDKGSKYFKNPEQGDKGYLPVKPLRL